MARLRRLDAELVRRGLARSREQAAELIDAGRVDVGGADGDQGGHPGRPCGRDRRPADAGRARLRQPRRHKLLGALDAFAPAGWRSPGRRCLDAGASTGGFTDVLLRARRRARGRGRRRLRAAGLGAAAGSAGHRARPHERPRPQPEQVAPARRSGRRRPVLHLAHAWCCRPWCGAPRPDADLVLMVKPQFEVGRERLGPAASSAARAARPTPSARSPRAALELGPGLAGRHGQPVAGPERQRRVLPVAAGGRARRWTTPRRARRGAGPPDRSEQGRGSFSTGLGRDHRRNRRWPPPRVRCVLLEMRLRGLGVIRTPSLELGPGLTVVTGETGAGKTMVVTGLGLLFGGRADAGRVARGAGPAVVEGRLAVAPDGAVGRRGGRGRRRARRRRRPDVSRTVSAEGRSRAHVGGRPVPVGDAGRGRRASWSPCTASPTSSGCCGPAGSAAALDRFAGDDAREAAGAPTAQAWHAAGGGRRPARRARRRRPRERAQEADLLRLGLGEIERVDPQPGEDEELRPRPSGSRTPRALRMAAATAHAGAAPAATRPTDAADAPPLLGAARRALEARPRPRPGAGRPGRPAGRGRPTWSATSRPSWLATPRSLDADPARLAARPRAAGRAARADPQVRRTTSTACSPGPRRPRRGSPSWTATTTGSTSCSASVSGCAPSSPSWPARSRAAGSTAAGRFWRGGHRRAGRAGDADAASMVGRSRRSPRGPASRAGPDGVDEVELRLVPHPGAPSRPLQQGRVRR